MKTLTMMRGLPGSGKTTLAKSYQDRNPNTVRVNKDDLRAMLHNSKHSKGRESFVLEVRDFIIKSALLQGKNVICDDTNYNPIHEERLRQIAESQGADFEIDDISDPSDDHVKLCVERDLKRPNSVGSGVIYKMRKQYILKEEKVEPAKYLVGADDVIICDLDGTLALFEGNPYERDFLSDKLNEPVKTILDQYSKVIILSGRSDKFKDQTIEWLDKNSVTYDELHMRAEGDDRKDSIVKREMYEQYVKDIYNVLFVLDDRNQVVNLWRSLGLTCLQVAPGDF